MTWPTKTKKKVNLRLILIMIWRVNMKVEQQNGIEMMLMMNLEKQRRELFKMMVLETQNGKKNYETKNKYVFL